MIPLTVLMPTFNGRRYIDQQIKSILGQSYSCLKLVILDDCSTDDTYDILNKWSTKDSRVEVYRNNKNLGAIRTFEKLLGMVDTAYFSLSDQDDYWKPNKLADSVAFLIKMDVDLVYTDLIVADSRLNTIDNSKWRYSNTPPVFGHNPLPVILKNPVTGCTIVGRTSFLEKALPFPLGVPMHDRWLATVACTENGIAAFDKPTVLYRQHGGNEIGGLPYGIRGLIKRIRKDENGSVKSYFKNRVKKRLAILSGLERIGYLNYSTRFVEKYYRSPWFARILMVGVYSKIVARHAGCIGIKNVMTDISMSLLPF